MPRPNYQAKLPPLRWLIIESMHEWQDFDGNTVREMFATEPVLQVFNQKHWVTIPTVVKRKPFAA